MPQSPVLTRLWNGIRSWKHPRKKPSEETQELVQDVQDIPRYSSPPIAVPKKIPNGPIHFDSVGDGDKFITGLEENHVETKEQLYDLSQRPTGFDARKELKASLESDIDDLDDMILTSKKVKRMHFIGHYNFVNSNNFKAEK